MKRRLALCAALFLACATFGFTQGEQQDFLRSMGKIYVVVAVLAVIFFILIAYLIYLDRKITKLENSIFNGREE
jgi:exosortase/archaeosortase